MNELIFYGFLFVIAIWVIYNIVNSHRTYRDSQNVKDTQRDYYQSTTSKNHGSNSNSNAPESEDFPSPIITNVAGVTFEGRQSVVDSLHIGEILILVQEPDNPYDKKAIRVERRNGVQVGYIPKELAKDMDWHFDALGTPRPSAEVIKKTGSRWKGQNLGVVISIQPPGKAEFMYRDDWMYRR